MSKLNDEWSLLSDAYEDVLLPRFEPIYKFIANSILDHIKLNKRKEKYQLLDYGTGPGEPILAIAKLLKDNEINNVEFEGIDLSIGMISIAKHRLKQLNLTNINFNTADSLSNLNHYDIIISSLVLPYISDKKELLNEFHKHLNYDGLLINCHWPHPSQVPFLTLLKRINVFMSTDKHVSFEDLETDVSFSCSNEETTKEMFREQGFIVNEYISLPSPMSFPDIRTFLSFSRIASWFNDENLYAKAENETKRILHEEYGIELNLNEPLHLSSSVIITVASKQ